MRIGDYDVYAPLMLGEPANAIEMFGAVALLWMQSAEQRSAYVGELETQVLPFLTTEQYILVYHQARPIFYLSFALFNAQTELRYLTLDYAGYGDDGRALPLCNGNRFWILDWLAPLGHSREMAALMQREVLLNHCCRALYHKGDRLGPQVLRFRGRGVSRQQAAQWWQKYPLVRDLPERGFTL
ncbi:toxin-activating lysine-acyltransferase [Xenorhabdus sp. KK7.4]|uniref:toxin-activating lysine-acyltransferase n=1 Tax=Xenorhabdus sp. KK7.4 TaxID=1851572 RepID=UPI000C047847|nr:toxin-activating lysine-acyltransferase [Xenorhabdus sp. KK7.4]PHM55898.1 RTX-I toxin-activating lysine-acyltransferase ApxIC [Xenorhabdus sp. KK7.4]PHM59597.1 RTX-I toxin-activating lysine-acyltransferase ApxIC [Xenorhabdus sp. KK7.4]